MKLPPAFKQGTQQIHVIIETPKGSVNKFTFDPGTELFKLGKVLPAGLVFPLHFGFIPGTKGEDGDPLDVLVLMDGDSYPGICVECRLLGVIEAQQTEKNGDSMRNDRFVAAATQSHRYSSMHALTGLDSYLLQELTTFFITYNTLRGKIFKPLANSGPKKATALIKKYLVK